MRSKAMTPAEFKCAREMMGLSTAWLAKRWGVSNVSVQRWERNRELPKAIERDMNGMLAEFLREVDEGSARCDGSIEVPRTDAECLGEYPSAYYRRVAALVALRTSGEIVFRSPGL